MIFATFTIAYLVVTLSYESHAMPTSDDYIIATTLPLVTPKNNANITQLTLALMTPLTGKLGFDKNVAASTLALEQARLNGYLPGITVK